MKDSEFGENWKVSRRLGELKNAHPRGRMPQASAPLWALKRLSDEMAALTGRGVFGTLRR